MPEYESRVHINAVTQSIDKGGKNNYNVGLIGLSLI